MSSRTRPSSGRNTATKSSPIADSLIQVVSITVSSGGTDRPLMKTMVFLSEPPRGSIRAIEGIQEGRDLRSEEHTSELQSLMRISYAVFCLKKKNKNLSKR